LQFRHKPLDSGFTMLKIPFQQSLKRPAVPRFVFAHLMHGVVYGVKVQLLGLCRNVFFTLCRAVFRHNAHFKILFGGYIDNLAQQFREFGGMFRFFKRDPLVRFRNLGIPFTVGLAAHSEVHTHFDTFARKVLAKPFDYFGVNVFGDANSVFIGENQIRAGLLFEFSGRRLALGTEFGRLFARVDIAANRTNKLFHNDTPNWYLLSYGNYYTWFFNKYKE
jgi:hypothetical protein